MTKNTPILLIPGLGTSPRTYSNILPQLWQHGHVTIANQIHDDSMEAMAKCILTAAPPSFALIGHSMGGYVAFEIMRQAPERVLKLALMNTSARPDGDEAKEKRKAQIEKAKHGMFAEIIEGALPAFLHTQNKDDENLRRIITVAHNDAGADAYIRQQMAIMGRPDSRPDLENIKVPTLVITGSDDKLIPLEPSQEIVSAITGAELVVIQNAGHMAALEQPEEVSKVLADWLAK